MGLGDMPTQRLFSLIAVIRPRKLRTLVLSCLCYRIFDNLLPDLVEIVELLARDVQELAPFIWVVRVRLVFRG